VFTSPGLGRPAENLTHYTHADAHYLGELPMLRATLDVAIARATAAARPVYLLLPADAPPPRPAAADAWSLHEVARREGPALREWFVDPAKAPQGATFARVEPATGRRP
jgi:hypothetical protein